MAFLLIWTPQSVLGDVMLAGMVRRQFPDQIFGGVAADRASRHCPFPVALAFSRYRRGRQKSPGCVNRGGVAGGYCGSSCPSTPCSQW